MSVEVLGAFLTAINTMMLIRMLFNDLHQIRGQLQQLEHDFITHIAREGLNG